jgi:hypothetical protein
LTYTEYPYIIWNVQTVIETAHFLRDARKVGISDEERTAIVRQISVDPVSGDLVPGTGGARKIRVAGRGKGKSGGYRVITYYGGIDIPVFLLGVLSKGERANLSKAEQNELRKELAGLAEDYRASVRKKVASLPPRRRRG